MSENLLKHYFRNSDTSRCLLFLIQQFIAKGLSRAARSATATATAKGYTERSWVQMVTIYLVPQMGSTFNNIIYIYIYIQ